MTTLCVKDLIDFAVRALDEVPDEFSAQALRAASTQALLDASESVSRQFAARTFNLCAIVNAKSGRCTENCAWCAQSRHFQTRIEQYPLIDPAKTLEAARKAKQRGCSRFSLVTGGRKLSLREVREAAELVRAIRRETNLEACISAGLLNEKEFRILAQAGAVRCHCNLEAAESVFEKFCSTHSFADKVKTLEAARRAGLQICSGGIIGLGESEADRVSLALALRRLEVPSIPINILSPIAGTALADQPLLDDEAILRAVALFRLINPRAQLRFAGGRARLSQSVQLAAMKAGINSAIAGDMLTTAGTDVEADKKLAAKAGYRFEDDDALAFDRAHLWHPYASAANPPAVEMVESAHDARIVLADGRELIDGISSWWCASFGHRHPDIVKAVIEQAQKMPHVMFAGLTHEKAVELGRRLLELAPKGLEKIFYADSGSVAVEAAMKMALQYQRAASCPDRTGFMTLAAGYHGDTWNAMSVCDPEGGMHALFSGLMQKRFFVPSPSSRFDGEFDERDAAVLEAYFEKHGAQCAAFILEPIVQAAGAMRFYHPQYLKHARRLCSEYGVLLVLDEIATGFGRTGRTFACDWAQVTPDIMTVGKALTGGVMTLSAVLTTNAVADAVSSAPPRAFMHGPTFMANPLACAAACAALDVYAGRDWLKEVSRIQAKLRAALAPFAGRAGVRDVRVCGAIGVVETEREMSAARLQPEFVKRGVWIRPIGRLLYLMPPFVVSDAELDVLTSAFAEVLEEFLASDTENSH